MSAVTSLAYNSALDAVARIERLHSAMLDGVISEEDAYQASASGVRGQASASGDYGQASASGDYGQASASGYGGQASASGYGGQASASGGEAVAGPNGWIAIVWHDGARRRLAVGYVGENVKALTRYRVDARGQFVELGPWVEPTKKDETAAG